MAFRKHSQDLHDEENSPMEWEEEEKPSLFGKASRSLKGLFARNKDDYDDYDYDDEDDFDDDFEELPRGKKKSGRADSAGVSEPSGIPAWDDEWDMEESGSAGEDYGDAGVWVGEEEEDPFARFAAAGSGNMAWPVEEIDAGEYAEDYYGEDAGDEGYYVEDYAADKLSEGYEEYPADGEVTTEDYTAEAYDFGEHDFDEGGYEDDYYDFGEDDGAYEEAAEGEDGYYDYSQFSAYGEKNEEGYDEPDSYDYGEDGDYDYDGEDSREKGGLDALRDALDRYLIPGLGVVALCAVAAIAFAVITLLGGKSSGDKKGKDPAPVVSSMPTATPTPAELQAVGEPSGNEQTPGGSETAPPTVAAAKATRDANGALVPAGDNAVVPKRSAQLSLDSFATTTHIGNSFVEGMQLWSDIDSCHYVCADGVSLDNMIGNYLYFVTVRNYDSIYLTLGINEIGWPTKSFIEKYEKVIDYIRSDATERTRKATIYVTSVFPTEGIMETVAGESGNTIHKATIQEFNEELKAMCARKGCWYLDVYSELAGEDGYLPANIAASDHIHFEKTGYRIWTDYLRDHYVDETMLG